MLWLQITLVIVLMWYYGFHSRKSPGTDVSGVMPTAIRLPVE